MLFRAACNQKHGRRKKYMKRKRKQEPQKAKPLSLVILTQLAAIKAMLEDAEREETTA